MTSKGGATRDSSSGWWDLRTGAQDGQKRPEWQSVSGNLLWISAMDRVVIYCGFQVTGWQFHRIWGHDPWWPEDTDAWGFEEQRIPRELLFPFFPDMGPSWVAQAGLDLEGSGDCPMLGLQWDTVPSLSELLKQSTFKQGAKTQTPHKHQPLCSLTVISLCSPITLSKAFGKDSLNMAWSTNSVYLLAQWKVASKLLISMSLSQKGPWLPK